MKRTAPRGSGAPRSDGQGPALLQASLPRCCCRSATRSPAGLQPAGPSQARSVAGTSFLHQHRLGEDLQAPASAAPPEETPDPPCRRRSACCGTTSAAGPRRPPLQPGAGATDSGGPTPAFPSQCPDGWGEGWCRVEALRQGHHQGQTGWGRQFSRGSQRYWPREPHMRGELQHGRHGNRQEAMGVITRLWPAGADCRSGAHAKLQAGTDPDHIHQRIHAPPRSAPAPAPNHARRLRPGPGPQIPSRHRCSAGSSSAV